MNPDNTKKAKAILSALKNFYGDVKADLNFSNLYELTIAVVLSAQTTDKQVNSVTEKLFKKYPDFTSLSKAKLSDVEKIIKSTGFYHTKARNIIALAKIVSEKFNSSIPDNIASLITLPGVGRKSANVIISIGFGKPGLAVDTHVARIAKRLGLTESVKPEIIEKDLCSIIPEEEWLYTHLLFIKHGRSLCKARGEECHICPIKSFCLYYKTKFTLL